MLRTRNRRDDERIPVELFLNEYVRDRLHRAVTTNLSPSGVYVHRVVDPSARRWSLGRRDRYVQLELALPGTSDTIWARGEIRYDELDLAPSRLIGPASRLPLVHGTGISFVDMARGHQRLLRDYVIDRKRRRLQEILELIRKNRYH